VLQLRSILNVFLPRFEAPFALLIDARVSPLGVALAVRATIMLE